MNQKFFELPEEKRTRIINAALEVFSQNDYKRASTDEIAIKAGISKGLLFYYFHNKKELYLYIYNYSGEYLKSIITRNNYDGITDFFEVLEHGAKCKAELIEKNPYIMDFSVRAFFSKNEEISEKMNEVIQKEINEAYSKYFKKLDYSKFREGISPEKIVQMLTWMADGYLHEKQRSDTSISLDDMMTEYKIWTDMFKKMAYKEEYL